MRSLKKYKTPKIEITVFECAEDIMTASGGPTKSLRKGVGDATYVKLDSRNWSDIYGN